MSAKFGQNHSGETLPETLPISSALRCSTERTSDWPKLDIRALHLVFSAHCLPSSIRKASIEGCSNVDAGGEDRIVVRWSPSVGSAYFLIRKIRTISDTDRRVLHAQASEPQSGDSSSLPDATLALPSMRSSASGHGPLLRFVYIPNTSGQINLLYQGELTDESRGLGVGTGPVPCA